jgi:hypothetical protein
MTRAELLSAIDYKANEYYGYPVTLSGVRSKNKQALERIYAQWCKRVGHNDTYKQIMGLLNLTDNQRMAYNMGYTDALTPEQAKEYERAMEHYRLSLHPEQE